MNNTGKIITAILVVISVLLLSLTVITMFFFKKENEMRVMLESKITESEVMEQKLLDEKKELKKKMFLQEEKAKEADERINSLIGDLELEEGLREELKMENTTLKEQFENEVRVGEQLRQDLTEVQENIKEFEGKFTEQTLRLEMQRKLKEVNDRLDQQTENPVIGTPEVTAEKGEGKVLSVNLENNFIIIDMGSIHGISEDMLMNIYRGADYLGEVQVTRVQAKMSVADPIDPFHSDKIQENDKVLHK